MRFVDDSSDEYTTDNQELLFSFRSLYEIQDLTVTGFVTNTIRYTCFRSLYEIQSLTTSSVDSSDLRVSVLSMRFYDSITLKNKKTNATVFPFSLWDSIKFFGKLYRGWYKNVSVLFMRFRIDDVKGYHEARHKRFPFSLWDSCGTGHQTTTTWN